MKRFGILALAGLFAIVGCSKKTELAGESAVEAGALAGGEAADATSGALGPALDSAVALDAPDYTHSKTSGFTWDAASGQYSREVSRRGMKGAATIKFVLNGAATAPLGHSEIWESMTPTNTIVTRTASGSKDDGTRSFTLSLTGPIVANTPPRQFKGSGAATHKNTEKDTDLTITITDLVTRVDKTKLKGVHSSGTFTFSGTVKGKTISGTITWVEGVGDGTLTVDGTEIKIHIDPDGDSYWEKDGKKTVVS